MFITRPPVTSRQLRTILVFLLVVLSMTGLGVLINYLMHMTEIQEGLLRGKPIPVPRNHIRFSLLLALTAIGGLTLWSSPKLRGELPRWTVAAPTVFLILLLHILAVRTGLLALYAGGLMLAIRESVRRRKPWLIAATLLLLAGALVAGYRFVPSFQSRIDYMRWDLQQFAEGKGGEYADSGRIASLLVGWEIWQEHPG